MAIPHSGASRAAAADHCFAIAYDFPNASLIDTKSRAWHSQTIFTVYPILSKSLRARASRILFAANFALQKPRFVLGFVAASHLACRCQKHP